MAGSFNRITGRMDPTPEDQQKPGVITFYKSTRSGRQCTTSDQKKALFNRILNMANVNASVIHRHNNPEPKCAESRRSFIRHLGLRLMYENTVKSASKKN
ncbi:hypothetical protein JTB14_031978 [Gonioctena quinquepunctata]|nr:hypothetical protein JTB14_031978 [Gonioctena quinquepunctata]